MQESGACRRASPPPAGFSHRWPIARRCSSGAWPNLTRSAAQRTRSAFVAFQLLRKAKRVASGPSSRVDVPVPEAPYVRAARVERVERVVAARSPEHGRMLSGRLSRLRSHCSSPNSGDIGWDDLNVGIGPLARRRRRPPRARGSRGTRAACFSSVDPSQATSMRTRIASTTLCALCTAIPIQALRKRFVG
jgi:hypothetical protein